MPACRPASMPPGPAARRNWRSCAASRAWTSSSVNSRCLVLVHTVELRVPLPVSGERLGGRQRGVARGQVAGQFGGGQILGPGEPAVAVVDHADHGLVIHQPEVVAYVV